jgi:hypothetical protein
VIISAVGTYQISGTLDDGQIIVDTTDDENVTLILAGVDITSQSSAPIYVANAEKVILNLAAGKDVLTFLPTKEYQSVLISSPELQNGESYVVYTGGNSTSTPVDGLYKDGDYTPGTKVASFTIVSIVTGDNGGMFGGPGGGRPGRP